MYHLVLTAANLLFLKAKNYYLIVYLFSIPFIVVKNVFIVHILGLDRMIWK